MDGVGIVRIGWIVRAVLDANGRHGTAWTDSREGTMRNIRHTSTNELLKEMVKIW